MPSLRDYVPGLGPASTLSSFIPGSTTPATLGAPLAGPENLAGDDQREVAGMTEVGKGFRSGRLGSDANYLASQEFSLRAAGRHDEADAIRNQIGIIQQRAGVFAPRVQKVEDAWANPTDAPAWLGGVVGQVGSSMVDSVATGVGASKAAQLVGLLPHPVAKAIGRAGSWIGAGAAAVPNVLNARGETANQMVEDPTLMANTTAEQRNDAAWLSGGAQGLVDTAMPSVIINRLGGAGIAKGVHKLPLVPRIAADMVGEGAQEVVQEGMKKGTLGYLNPNRDTSGDASDYLNSFASGLGMAPHAAASIAVDNGFRRLGVKGDGERGDDIDLSGKDITTQLAAAAKGGKGRSLADSIAYSELLHGTEATPDVTDQSGLTRRRDALLSELAKYPNAAALAQPLTEMNDRLSLLRGVDAMDEAADFLAPKLGLTTEQLAKKGGKLKNSLQVDPKDFGKGQIDTSEMPARTPEQQAAVVEAERQHKTQTARLRSLLENTYTQQHADAGSTFNPSIKKLLGSYAPELAAIMSPGVAEKPTAGEIARAKRIGSSIGSALGEKASGALVAVAQRLGVKNSPVFDAMHDEAVKVAEHRKSGGHAVHAQHMTERDAAAQALLDAAPEFDARMAKQGVDLRLEDNAHLREQLLSHMEDHADGEGVATQAQLEEQLEEQFGKEAYAKMMEIVGGPIAPRHTAAPKATEQKASPKPKLSSDDITDGETSDYEKRGHEKSHTAVDPGSLVFGHSQTEARSAADAFKPGADGKLMKLIPADRMDSDGRRSLSVMQLRMAQALRSQSKGYVYGRQKDGKVGTSAKELMDRQGVHGDQRVALMGQYLAQENPGADHTDFVETVKALPALRRVDELMSAAVQSGPLTSPEASRTLRGQLKRVMNYVANPEQFLSTDIPLSAPARAAQNLAIVKAVHKAHADIRGMIDGHESLAPMVADFKATHGRAPSTHELADHFFGNRFLVHAEKLSDRDYLKIDNDEFTKLHREGTKLLRAAEHQAHESGGNAGEHKAGMNLIHFRSLASTQKNTPADQKTVAIPAHKLVAWVRDMRNKHTGDTRTGDNTQSYSDNEKADQYLDDLKEGINALMTQKLVRGQPWIVNAAGERELFSEGMPPSLSVGDGRTHAEMKEARGKRADEKLQEEIAVRQAKPLGLKPMGEAVADHNAMHERDAEIGQDEADMQDADHVRESEEMMNGPKRDRAEREHLWKMAQVVLAAADRPPAVLNKLTAFTKAKYVADRLWRDYIGDKYADPDGKLYVDPNARKPTHAQQVEAHAKAVGAILSYVTATEKTAFDPSDKDKTYRGDHFIAPLAALLTPNHMAAIAEHYPNELEKVKLLQAKVASVLLHMAYGAEKATITPGQLKQAVDSLTGYADAAHDLQAATALLARAKRDALSAEPERRSFAGANADKAQAAITKAKSASPVQQPAYKQLLTDMALPYFEVARRRGYAARSADKARNEAVKNPGRERHFITPFAEMVFGEAPVDAPALTAEQHAAADKFDETGKGVEVKRVPPKSSVTGSVGASDSGKVSIDTTPKPRAISRKPKPTPVYGKAAPIDRMQEAWAEYLSAEQTRVLSDAHDVGDKGTEVVVPQGKFVVENRGDHTEVVFYPRRERTIADVQRERAEAQTNAKGDFVRTAKTGENPNVMVGQDVVDADTAAAEQGVDNVAALAGALAQSARSQKTKGVVAKRENNATIADAAAKLNAGATIQQVNAGIAAQRDEEKTGLSAEQALAEINRLQAAGKLDLDAIVAIASRSAMSPEERAATNAELAQVRELTSGALNTGGLVQKTVDSWSKKYAGGAKVTVATVPRGHALESFVSRLVEGATAESVGGMYMQFDGGHYILSFASGMRGKATSLSRLAHEFGHALEVIAFEGAPQGVKDKLVASYEADLVALKTSPAEITRFVSSARLFDDATALVVNNFPAADSRRVRASIAEATGEAVASGGLPGGITTFTEWFAENFSKFVTAGLATTLDPEVKSFWTGLMAKMKEFFNNYVSQYKPDASFKSWVESLAAKAPEPRGSGEPTAPAAHQAKESAKLAGADLILAPAHMDGGEQSPSYAGRLGAWANRVGKIYTPAKFPDMTGKTLYVSLPGKGRGFEGYGPMIKRVMTALDAGATVRTDNETNAGSAHNAQGEGALRAALIAGGYAEKNEGLFSSWTKAEAPKAEATLSSAIAQRLEYLNNPPADYTTDKAQAIKAWAARQLTRVQDEIEKIEKNVRFGVGEVGEYDDRLTELYDRRLDLKLLGQKADDVLEGDASLKGFEGDTVKNSLQTADTARALTPEEIKTFDKNKLGSAAPVSKDNEIVSTRIALRRMLGDKVATLFEESFPDMQGGADWNETKAIIRIATASSVPMMQRGYHEAMHAFYSLILKNSPEAQAMIERVTSDPKIIERMAAMLKDSPEAVEQMRNDAEERAAYAYQFWAAGMLDIGKKPETFFEKVQAFMRRVLGAVRESDKAMAIFTAFHDGKLTEPSAAGLAITKVMETGEWRAKMLKRFDKQAQAAYNEVMAAINVGMNSESPTARTIAMMFYSHPSVAKTAGKPGYIDSAQLARHQYENLIQAALRPLMGDNLERDMAELAQVLNGKAKAVQPHVEKAARDIYAALHRFHKYAREAGVDIGVRDATEDSSTYFPRVIQLETMIEKKAEFIDMLVTNYPSAMAQIGKSLAAQGKPAAPEDAAALIHQSYIDRGGIENAALSVMREDGVLNPFFASQNERKLHWIRDEHIAPFLSTDVVSTLTRYFSQGTRSAEYVRRFGEDGQKLKDMMARLGDVRFISKTGQVENYTEDGPVVKELKAAAVKAKAAKPDEWVDRRMEDLQRSFGAMEGSLGKDISAGYRQFQGNIMTYQVLRTLPLSLFSAMLDPNGLRVAGGTSENMWYAYRRGLLGVFNTWKDLVKGNPLGIKDPDKYEAAANAMGVIAPTMYLEQYGGVHSSEYSAGAARKINHKFFLANGLTSWDRDMRIAATKAAMESIVSNEANTIPAHSARWLKELGLAQNDGVVRTDADGELVTNKHVLAQMRADEKGTTKDEEMAQAEKDAHKIAVAVNRWVARAIMAPNAALRPSRASDPHYAMFFQLKSFTYAFTETTLKYAMAEAEEGNLNAGAQLMRGVPIMIAADMTKALLTNGGSLPGYMANWTMADWVLHGINRSGNLGTPQLGLDALHGAHGSIMGAVGTVGGPTVSQGIDLAAGALNGNLGTEVGKSIPFFNKIGQAAHSVGGMLDMGE